MADTPRLLHRRPRLVGVVAILLLALSIIGIRYWMFVGDHETTANAMIDGAEASFWVVANFKETQMSEIRPGQPARIRVRAYPDTVLRGRVESVEEGSARAIAHRVPVRIVLDEPPDPHRPLGPGMPVVATVVVR